MFYLFLFLLHCITLLSHSSCLFPAPPAHLFDIPNHWDVTAYLHTCSSFPSLSSCIYTGHMSRCVFFSSVHAVVLVTMFAISVLLPVVKKLKLQSCHNTFPSSPSFSVVCSQNTTEVFLNLSMLLISQLVTTLTWSLMVSFI